MFARIPNLAELELIHWKCHSPFQDVGFSSLANLKRLYLDGFILSLFPRLPESLVSFAMLQSVPYAVPEDIVLGNHLPYLVELTYTSWFSEREIDLLQKLLLKNADGEFLDLNSLTPLHKLNVVSNGGEMARSALTALLGNPRLSRLEELGVQYAPLDDTLAAALPGESRIARLSGCVSLQVVCANMHL